MQVNKYVLMKITKVTLKLLVLNNKEEGYLSPNVKVKFICIE